MPPPTNLANFSQENTFSILHFLYPNTPATNMQFYFLPL
jgi:hypothetical protein